VSRKPSDPRAHFTHNLLSAVERLADAPQRTLSLVTAQLGVQLPVTRSAPPPPHVTSRLEAAFDALSDLPLAQNVVAALDLACEVVQTELPSESVAAGLYDIDADEILFVSARGVGDDLLRGMAMPRARVLSDRAAEFAIITTGASGAADWIAGTPDSTVLLCPIQDDTTLLGVLALADPLCAADYTPHDMDLVRYVAGQLADYIRAHRRRPKAPAPPPSSEG